MSLHQLRVLFLSLCLFSLPVISLAGEKGGNEGDNDFQNLILQNFELTGLCRISIDPIEKKVFENLCRNLNSEEESHYTSDRDTSLNSDNLTRLNFKDKCCVGVL